MLADEPIPGRSLVTPFLSPRGKRGSVYDLFQSVHCPWFSHSSPRPPASFIVCGNNHKRCRCNKQIIRVSGQILTTKDSSGSIRGCKMSSHQPDTFEQFFWGGEEDGSSFFTKNMAFKNFHFLDPIKDLLLSAMGKL